MTANPFEFFDENPEALNPDQPATGTGGTVVTDADPLSVNLTSLYGEQQDVNPALVGSMLQGLGVLPAGSTLGENLFSSAIPPTVPRQEEISEELAKAFEIIDQNIFNREALLRNLNSFATLPEISHLLRTPGAIEELQGDYYANTLSWFSEQVGEHFSVESSQKQIAGVRTVDRFFTTHGGALQTGERDLLMSIWSAIPWGSDFLRDAAKSGEHPSRPFDSGGLFAPIGNLLGGDFRAGFRQLNAAPQDVQNIVNDPREQVAALALEYLNANPLETLEDRQRFIVKNYEWVSMKRNEQQGMSSGIGRLGERLAAPFRVISNDLATIAAAGPMDSLQAIFGNAKGPNEFAWRQHMSFGQNIALSMGANPGADAGTSFLSDGFLDTITSPVEKIPFVGTFLTDYKQYGNSFELSSGLFDMMLNLSPADPLNLIPNIGTGVLRASKVPRYADMSKAQAVFQALRPFSGFKGLNRSAGRMANLPTMGRGTTARFAWALMSRTVDELVEETSSVRAATWIARQSNRARIMERFPTLQNSPIMLDAMARTTDPGQITDLIRAGMKGGDIGLDAPLMVSRTAALLEEATDLYAEARGVALREGKLGLGQLSAIDNVSEADGVWLRSLGADLDELAQGVTNPALAARVVEGANEGVLEGVVRNGARVVSQGERVLSETLADGRVIDFFARGPDVVARVGDAVVGGLLASRKEVAVAADFGFKNATLASGKGIATTLVDLAEQAQPGALRGLSESSSISEQGLKFLQREATTRLGSGAIEPGVVLRASQLSADGGTKALVSRSGAPFKWLDLGADPTSTQKLTSWLATQFGASARTLTPKARQARASRAAANLSVETRQVVDNMDEFVFHGMRSARVGVTEQGGLSNMLERSLAYATDNGSLLAFRKSDLPADALEALARGDLEQTVTLQLAFEALDDLIMTVASQADLEDVAQIVSTGESFRSLSGAGVRRLFRDVDSHEGFLAAALDLTEPRQAQDLIKELSSHIGLGPGIDYVLPEGLRPAAVISGPDLTALKGSLEEFGLFGATAGDLAKGGPESVSLTLAAKLADMPPGVAASVLDSLDPQEMELLMRFTKVSGASAVRHGSGAVFTNRGARALVTGSDLADEASGVFDEVLLGPAHNLAVAQGAAANLRAGITPTLWSISDLPRMSKAKEVFGKTQFINQANRVGSFHRALRRAGAQFKYRAPGNISLTRGGEGASQLRDWIRVLGGSSDIAAKWVDEFIAANPANRNRVVLAAMQEVGEEIEHPLLSMGLLSFTNKQGHFTYFFDSMGKEIGLAKGADGGTTIKPLSISHFAKDIAMPDASEMLSSIRRFRSTKRGPARIGAVRRGVFGSTKQDRKALAQTYRSQIMRKTGEPVGLADEDLLAIAYSDVMGVGQFGRSNGLGYVHQMARMATKPLRMFHNAFSIAQLAGRAIPWSSRISLEESVRAGFTGLPTVWRNPKTYLNTFWDAHVIRAMPKQLSRQAQQVNGIVMDMFDIGIRSHDEILAGVQDLIPDIARLAQEADVSLDDLGRVRALVGHHLGRELIGGNANDLNMIGSRTNAARRTLLRNRSLRKRTTKLESKGFERGFTFEMDAPDILNRSIFSTFNAEVGAATLPIEWKPGAMSAGMVNNYGRGYGRQLHQMLGDPVNSRWGIGRMLANAKGGDAANFSVESFANSKWWNDLKPNAVDAALYRGGIDVNDNLALATWFLDDVVDEMVDTLLSPFWLDSTGAIDLARKEEVLQGLVTTGTLNGQMGSRAFHVTRSADNYEGFVATIQDFAQAAYQDNVALPAKMSVYFDPRMGQIGADKPFYRKLTDQVMQFAGEDVTQKLHRQPAFVHTFSEYFDHFKRLGWGDEAAREMANNKAVEAVNYIFFNNSNTTMFMKKMNNVIPFFSAWWEVLSTWAIKIPSQDFFPMGHASLFRRVDRFMDGLVSTGVIDIDEEGQYSLNLQEDLGESTAFGHALSKMGHSMVGTPATVVSHLAALGQLAGDAVNGDGFSFDSYQPKDMSAIAKDGFRIQIGSPVDPFTHGVMAVNQLGFGFFPETSFIASKLLARASFAGDTQLHDTTEETNITELSASLETDFGTLLAKNPDAFEQAWGKETLARVRNGTIDPDTLTIPAGITFQVPDSSVMSRLINQTFFPFGQLHTAEETITAVTPSTIGYMMRGLGIMIGDENVAGEFLTGVFGPTGQFQVDAEVTSQLMHLEATEGLVTKATELATEINLLVENAINSPDGPLQVSGLEEGLPVLLNPDHPLGDEFRSLVEEMSRANAQMIARAEDNAGWALIIRGLTGSFGPSTPRMFFKEQEQAGQYWASRNLAEEARARGSANFADQMDESRINGIEDLMRTVSTIGHWLDDPTGDQAKAFLRQSHPSLMAFTQGKTFWGPGGPPPETKGIEEFFEQVEAGERPVYPPDVFIQKLARANVAIDREVAIINEYGNDQAQQAVQILNDWSAYKDLTEDFDRQYEALDWWDEDMNDGGYRDWVERNPTDRLTLYETLKKRFNRAIDNVDDVLNAVDFLSITPDERRQIAGILKSSTRGIADIIQEFDAYSNDETFDNQRERLIGNYFTNVADPFYTQRTGYYDEIARAETKEERSILFDKIRDLENQQWVSAPSLEDGNGALFPVPNELVRVWNGKTDEDKINRKLRWVAQKPEWMSLQASQTLVLDNSDFVQFVPTTQSQMKIYSDFAEAKREIIEFARANPEDISEYERNNAISELQESLERQLVESGRGAEVHYARAWPIQRLALAGKLPPVLKPVLEMVNQVEQALDAAEVGPTSSEGRRYFLQLVDHLEQTFYPRNPGAMEAIDQLGLVMFDEPLRSTVYAKLLYGDYFGTLD